MLLSLKPLINYVNQLSSREMSLQLLVQCLPAWFLTSVRLAVCLPHTIRCIAGAMGLWPSGPPAGERVLVIWCSMLDVRDQETFTTKHSVLLFYLFCSLTLYNLQAQSPLLKSGQTENGDVTCSKGPPAGMRTRVYCMCGMCTKLPVHPYIFIQSLFYVLIILCIS